MFLDAVRLALCLMQVFGRENVLDLVEFKGLVEVFQVFMYVQATLEADLSVL